MKKYLILSGLLALLPIITTGCSDDDDDVNPPTAHTQKITVNISGIDNLVDSVYLTIDPSAKNILAKTIFNKGQFEFNFPESIHSDYLYPVSSDDLFKLLTISDKSAQICFGEFHAVKNNQLVGYFSFTDGAAFNSKDAYYVYTDKDVTITGNIEKGTQTYLIANCAFLKGWNKITTYSKDSETEFVETWTTESFNNLKWIYNSYQPLSQ